MSSTDLYLIIALLITSTGWAIYASIVWLYPFQTRPGNPLDWDEDEPCGDASCYGREDL